MNDRWPISHTDLTRFRIVYAVFGLLTLPSFTWVGDYPDSLYRPPPGPFRLLEGFPPAPVLAGLGLVLAIALSCLLVGVRVPVASCVVTLTMITGFGFTYSLGKIDHNLLVALTPSAMAAAGWSPGGSVRRWVLRLWAFTIGVGMLTAGIAKLTAGWLDPTTHAVQGFTFQQVYSFDLTGWLGAAITHVSSPWFWEPMDWAAVLLECSVVVLALLGLRWLRLGLAFLALFHLGVMLMMNIAFAGSIVVYAAFVPWSRLHVRPVRVPASGWVAVGLALAVWQFVEQVGNADGLVGTLVVFTGAMIGLWYMGHRLSGRPGSQTVANTMPILRPPVADVLGVTVGAVEGIAPAACPPTSARVFEPPR